MARALPPSEYGMWSFDGWTDHLGQELEPQTGEPVGSSSGQGNPAASTISVSLDAAKVVLANYVCTGSDCPEALASACDTVTCGQGQTCVDGQCVLVDACDTVTCSEGQSCVDGVCVPVDGPCANITCGQGQTCVDGQCVSVDGRVDEEVGQEVGATNTRPRLCGFMGMISLLSIAIGLVGLRVRLGRETDCNSV